MIDRTALERAGQLHLIQFWEDLSPAEQASLEAEISNIDFEQLKRLVAAEDKSVDWGALAARAESPPAFMLADKSASITPAQARQAGEEAIRAGKVGMILVAGGQGSRLGFDLPKGMFPIGPISERTLYQMHCDRLLAVMKRYDVSIPMYVMTSPATDKETKNYFASIDYGGLTKDQLQIFCQGTMPAVDARTGNVLLSSPSSIALSPDGHGGLVAAFGRSGCLKDAKARGIEYLYYAQVDNPLAQLCDPTLIGYHLLAGSQMTTQVVKKRFAKEKVGNVVMVDGKVQIIEYSDLPDSAAETTNADGSLKLWAGNIAIHVFDRTFLESVVESSDSMPFHRANKKVPFVDSSGAVVQPKETNAIKFEKFVFDLLPLASKSIVVEGDPKEVFAPVKNADGAPVDTPAATKQMLLDQYHTWLKSSGCTIAEGVRVEINSVWALDAGDVATKLPKPVHFAADTYLQ